MKVILLYLVLEKLVSEHFRMSEAPLSFLLVYTAFSKSFFFYDCYVFKFHRTFRIGRKQTKKKQCYVSHKMSSGSRILDW